MSDGRAIPISRPFLGDAERSAIQQPLADGWLVQGPRVAEFEHRVAAFCGAQHAVATTSCTTALHLSLAALGAGPGDEIVVPAFTWIASANVVEYVGARPVFCDIELDSFNLDPDALQASVGQRTAGVIAVHLFGRAADMTRIGAVAAARGLWVLEDAACALGTRVGEAHAGTLGHAGCFSFHPRKSITTGEGGMVVTDDGKLAGLARSLRDHGASRSDRERHLTPGGFRLAEFNQLGFNYRMTDLQGALGAAQMDRLEWILAERSRQAAFYQTALRDLEWLRLPQAPAGETHGWQSFVCLYAPEQPTPTNVVALGERRDRMMAALEEEGIATRPGTHSPPHSGFYRERYGITADRFPRARIAERLSIALPLFAGLTEPELERVADAVRRLGP
ncbi:MAG: DegT/DnrJ/EryC1/StrS family aminotransferase [Solirubrobacteraceae bacterium]